MRKRTFAVLCVVALVGVIAVSCSSSNNGADGNFLKDLLRPQFNAYTKRGELTSFDRIFASSSTQVTIVKLNGKAKIRVKTDEETLYIDPLALKPELLGEHPREKLLRLHNSFGVPIDFEFDDSIFQSATFEYLAGKTTSGIISEVFPDGTFLVIPNEIPSEWKDVNNKRSSPTHFHVDTHAFLMSSSESGLEYRTHEEELLALPYEEQRNPPVAIAAQECRFYYKTLDSAWNNPYQDILHQIGFNPAIFWSPQLFKDTDGSIISPINDAYYGQETKYFGFSSRWVSTQTQKLGLDDAIGHCDTVNRVSKSGDEFYFVLEKNFEPQIDKRNVFMRADSNGEVTTLYVAPGSMLMLRQHPLHPNLFFISSEGWPGKESGGPDPRWQSVYLADTTKGGEYEIIRYPLPNSKYAPEGQQSLYGHSEFTSKDGRFLYAILYGFEEQGGGLWVIDLAKENFYENKEAFAQIFSWDHALDFTILPSMEQPPHTTVIMTGKEVNDDFAMTLNILKIKFAGLDTKLISKERLISMVGWNPVPFAYQKISDEEMLVLVETYYNYESYLVPRAKGVYITTVSLR